MMGRAIGAALAFVLAGPAGGEAPVRSLIPIMRLAEAPTGPLVVDVLAGPQAPRVSLRPAMRPGGGSAAPLPIEAAVAAALDPGPAASTAPLPPSTSAYSVAALPPAGTAAQPPGPTVDALLPARPAAAAAAPSVLVRAAAAEAPAPTLIALRSTSALAVNRSLRPAIRPADLVRIVRARAVRNTPSRVTEAGPRGAVCGDPGIIGERLSPVVGRIQGCGIGTPVRVREIDGVTLSQPATINCETARALRDWLDDGVRPTVGRRGGGVESLRVVASYSCRTRNSQPGARLSEHALGNAIDIAAIGLANGREIAVLEDWGSGRDGRMLREMHEAACGTFGTVLGPESDRHHRDHFHLDVASYRSGPYCR